MRLISVTLPAPKQLARLSAHEMPQYNWFRARPNPRRSARRQREHPNHLKGNTMKIEKVGLMTPGDMGQGVAIQIKARGFTVCTALDERSDRSRTLAREADIIDVGTVERLVTECDVVLSVMNPGAAVDFARDAATALRSTGRHTLIVDCNAIAPDTVHGMARMIEAAGGRFLDAGIIGSPPRGKVKANLYVSGPGAADLEALGGPQLAVKVVSERIGDASASVAMTCVACAHSFTSADRSGGASLGLTPALIAPSLARAPYAIR
jgi:hypothetical protein